MLGVFTMSDVVVNMPWNKKKHNIEDITKGFEWCLLERQEKNFDDKCLLYTYLRIDT